MSVPIYRAEKFPWGDPKKISLDPHLCQDDGIYTMFLLNTMKQDFPIFRKHPELVYLDSAATSLKPQVVLAAMEEYYTSYSANIHRGLYPLSEQATAKYEQSKQIIAEFIGANSSKEIIYTKNTTEAINAIAVSLSRTESLTGLTAAVSLVEHHANFVPWQQLAQQEGMRFVIVDVDSTGRINSDLLSKQIDRTTKVFAFCAVSNVTGIIQDIEHIISIVKTIASDCLVVIDAAQAVAHMPIDVRAWGADAVAFSGHKLFGPTGIGVLWAGETLLQRLAPYQYGGGMISSVSGEKTTFAGLPDKFEAGTPPIAEAIGLAAAVQYLSTFGLDTVKAHEQTITTYALEKLTALSGVRVFGPVEPEDRVGVIPFVVEGIHHHDVAQVLAGQQVCIRAGHHCAMPFHDFLQVSGTSRASVSLYNTKEDIDVLIEGLQKVIRVFAE